MRILNIQKIRDSLLFEKSQFKIRKSQIGISNSKYPSIHEDITESLAIHIIKSRQLYELDARFGDICLIERRGREQEFRCDINVNNNYQVEVKGFSTIDGRFSLSRSSFECSTFILFGFYSFFRCDSWNKIQLSIIHHPVELKEKMSVNSMKQNCGDYQSYYFDVETMTIEYELDNYPAFKPLTDA